MIYLSNSPNNKDRALHKGKQSKITSLQERLSVLAVKGILGNSLSQKRGVPLIISGRPAGGLIFFFFWRRDHMIFRGKRNGNQYYLAELEEGTIEKLIGTEGLSLEYLRT